MKASELIERLGELVKEYGDLDVVYPEESMSICLDVRYICPINERAQYERESPIAFELY